MKRTPQQEQRLDELLDELAELLETYDELYLLVSFIRTFYEVKKEYRNRPPELKLVKP